MLFEHAMELVRSISAGAAEAGTRCRHGPAGIRHDRSLTHEPGHLIDLTSIGSSPEAGAPFAEPVVFADRPSCSRDRR